MYKSEHRPIHTTKHRLICPNQTETHTYQQILSHNSDRFLQLKIGSYMYTNTTNTHPYPQTFTCRNHRTHTYIFKTKHKLVCTKPTNTHTYQSEHRHIHTIKHRLIRTNQTETHMYQQNLCTNHRTQTYSYN